ncbi:MAG TPA: hypothetical protein PLP27_05410 [Crocinitomicaceae bacterium]|nr:hypothetical protein [Crocinitomicaceae bacterium]
MKNNVIILSLLTVSIVIASCNSTKPVIVGENEVSPYTQENTQQTPTEKPAVIIPSQEIQRTPKGLERLKPTE